MRQFNLLQKNIILLGLVLFLYNPVFAQEQNLCFEAVEQYSVDENTSSSYEWEIEEDVFQGNISDISASGNSIEINWGNSPEGAYTLTVIETNSEGCPGDPVSLVININNPPEQPDVVIDQPECGEDAGAMTVTSPTGDLISYSIDGGATFSNTTNFDDLAPGDYTLVAQNEFGCISEETTFTIDEILTVPETPEVAVTSPECGETQGSISITSLEDPAYSYSIDGGNTFSTDTDFDNLDPGNYDVVISHNDGCTSEAVSVTIEPAPIVPDDPTYEIAQPDCGEVEGLVTVLNPTGPNLEFTVNGIDWQTDTDFYLTPGVYELQVRNTESECTSEIVSITIDEAPEIPETSPIQFN